jgi:hypothetical protein
VPGAREVHGTSESKAAPSRFFACDSVGACFVLLWRRREDAMARPDSEDVRGARTGSIEALVWPTTAESAPFNFFAGITSAGAGLGRGWELRGSEGKEAPRPGGMQA